MSRRKYNCWKGHQTVFRARQWENTAETHKATKLEDVFIDTKSWHKYWVFLKKLITKYTSPINQLTFKDTFNENAVAKFSGRSEDSRITSSLNNMAFNVWEQYPPILIKQKMMIKLRNFWIHWKRWWSPAFAIPFLCWYYTEGYLEKPYWFNNMKCFCVNVNEQPEELVKLFNRGYTLIETKLNYFEFTEESKKNIIIPNLRPQQYWNYLKTKNTAGESYDSTHFCNIRYNKYKKLIEEVDRRWDTSLWINCSYTLKTRIECIKKWEIRPELYFIWNADEE